VIDPAGVERGGAPFGAVHLVALLQEQLRQVAAVLPRDAGDQVNSAGAIQARRDGGHQAVMLA